ncbi:MAG: hypothetical protein HOB18_02240 [Nitrospina sp.]|nr:hypothetical protein [Nitrospina sp.]
MKNKRNPNISFFLKVSIVFSFLILTCSAQAHRDDFIDETLVYETLEQGEIELEYGFDYGDRPEPSDKFTRHIFAIEYGLSERFMINGKLLVESGFDSALAEFRYRLFEEGEKPIDISFSTEFEVESVENDSDEYEVEPRLILSKDFEKLNFTLNLPLKIHFKSAPSEFIPAFALRYSWEEAFSIGTEVKYNTFKNEGSIIPQVWFSLPEHMLLKLGYSQGFDQNSESFMRFFLEKEF